ncbi:hypothetical protein GCM10010965_25720 [Caldalkalibacillus thermarum]|nr:hypothetical protein GCM10010965_25720 [Caldalkalibacillus thermarum]
MKNTLIDESLPRKAIVRERNWFKAFFRKLAEEGIITETEYKVLYWHKIRGLKQKEAAQRLDLTIDQVKKAVYRGKRKLVDKADAFQVIWEEFKWFHDRNSMRLSWEEERRMRLDSNYLPVSYPEWEGLWLDFFPDSHWLERKLKEIGTNRYSDIKKKSEKEEKERKRIMQKLLAELPPYLREDLLQNE